MQTICHKHNALSISLPLICGFDRLKAEEVNNTLSRETDLRVGRRVRRSALYPAIGTLASVLQTC